MLRSIYLREAIQNVQSVRIDDILPNGQYRSKRFILSVGALIHGKRIYLVTDQMQLLFFAESCQDSEGGWRVAAACDVAC